MTSYVMVPVEATEEMLAAACELSCARPDCVRAGCQGHDINLRREEYDYAIAARPSVGEEVVEQWERIIVEKMQPASVAALGIDGTMALLGSPERRLVREIARAILATLTQGG